MLSAAVGNSEAVQELLLTASPNDATAKDITAALLLADRHGHSEVVRVLLAAKCTGDLLQKQDGQTPLWISCLAGQLPCVKLLIKAGAKLDVLGPGGCTPLVTAAANGHVDVVRELLWCRGGSVNKDARGQVFGAEGVTALWAAAYLGHREMLALLMEAGVSKESQTMDGRTPLWVACERGHIEVVRALLDAGANTEARLKLPDGMVARVMRRSESTKPQENVTPLYAASQAGRLEIVQMLLGAKAVCDAPTKDSTTPLWTASKHGHLDVAGANKEIRHDKLDSTPLWIACDEGRLEVASVLVAAGSRVDVESSDGRTPLWVAAKGGHEQIARLLLAAGAAVNRADAAGMTPLHAAASAGQTALVSSLIAAGASVESCNNAGCTPLVAACKQRHAGAARVLLSAGARVDTSRGGAKKASKPLLADVAAGKGAEQDDVVRLLLEYGAARTLSPSAGGAKGAELTAYLEELERLTASTRNTIEAVQRGDRRAMLAELQSNPSVAHRLDLASRKTALHAACEEGNEGLLRVLVTTLGVNLDVASLGEGETPLHVCVRLAREPLCRMLLKEGVQVNMPRRDGCRPLHLAVLLPAPTSETFTLLLLECGKCDVNAPNGRQATPLHLAAEKGDVAVVEALLAAGAAVDCVRTGDRARPLHLAVKGNNEEVVQLLEEAGARIDVQDSTGTTPLVLAASLSHNSLCELLLGAGADANIPRFGSKDSALHIAARSGFLATTRLLLDNGANPDAVNESGETPLSAAIDARHYDCADAIIRAGAKLDGADSRGDTLLHKAALRGDEQAVRLLIEGGADCTLRNNVGHTPDLCAVTHELEVLLAGLAERQSPKSAGGAGPSQPRAFQPNRAAARGPQQRREPRVGRTRTAPESGLSETAEASGSSQAAAAGEAEEPSGTLVLYNGRFAPLDSQPLLKGGSGIIILATDQRRSGERVAIKLCADKALRDRTVKALSELRDGQYVVSLADPSCPAACVFDCPALHPVTPYAIALKCGHQSLEDVLAKVQASGGRFTVNEATAMFESVVRAVDYMHGRGWVHCDVKPANLVEFEGRRLKLIDLDRSCRPGDPVTGLTYAICSPDVAAQLAKGKPVSASPEIDVWALGCILYQMLQGEMLVNHLVNGANEMDAGRVLRSLADVTQGTVDCLIDRINGRTPKDKNAVSLLRKMLQVQPEKRQRTDKLLEHELFWGGLARTYDTHQDVIQEVRQNATRMEGAVERVAHNVNAMAQNVNAMAEALEARTKRLDDLGLVGAKLEEIKAMLEVGQNLMLSLADNAKPRTFVVVPEVDEREQARGKGTEKRASWLHDVLRLFEPPPGRGRPSVQDSALRNFMNRVTRDRFRVYLVCELSGEPQGHGYVITKPTETVAKLVPAMQIGFRVLAAANNLALVARALAPPPFAPGSIPPQVMNAAGRWVDALSKKSSVEDFACVHRAFDLPEGQRLEQVGASARVFSAFLEKADPTNHWAGLQRFVTPSGQVLWASPKAIAEARRRSGTEGPAEIRSFPVGACEQAFTEEHEQEQDGCLSSVLVELDRQSDAGEQLPTASEDTEDGSGATVGVERQDTPCCGCE
ncbi:hypothetical protein HYH03_002003 [Edaphochlamys debaryana]|uniref:Protein kinase domain-containing protein n=1 Tax=Edaphochlamys debaryana TaxID=47281 RepID=A0A835YKV8_9CHLO|nr:hypothetical protein HYH03_002003 [Edaphochlamys debaryana]|eukprot:KAG2500435.1 hypothetical protein HYH03_002003 [Edaphochlamys debaryana]